MIGDLEIFITSEKKRQLTVTCRSDSSEVYYISSENINLRNIDLNLYTIDKSNNTISTNNIEYNKQLIDDISNFVGLNIVDNFNFVVDKSNNNITLNLLDYFYIQ